jgi:hypothetical protein
VTGSAELTSRTLREQTHTSQVSDDPYLAAPKSRDSGRVSQMMEKT